MGRGLGVHASQGWVKTNYEKAFGYFMVPQSGVGRVWRRFKAHLNNFLLLRCVGKRNLHEFTT
jgi:hypothetical protein